ncbi:hypothetical protein SASPL_117284 [Salvia splendens]|uniref:Fe2OG dioxygenase domain-containing protein n=1 Tax=Salvia splendens TaxID=180675 RepID=A0A8X8ZY07_SALSN|nr:hypothetical protein SASPL_117284 [Salvia splendens]
MKYSAPVIDMKESENLAEKIVKACEEWGCFKPVNHGVAIELMTQMKAVTLSLMDLPMEVKQKTPTLSQAKATPHQTSLALSSRILVCTTWAPPVPSTSFALRSTEVLSKYAFALYDLGHFVMEGLGMDGDLFEDWPCQLKINKYNYSPQSVGLTGAVLHTDPGFLTILQDDEMVNGLEAIHKITGDLVPLHPIAGSLVVNAGDTANAWSNGRFCNVKHRVQCYEPTVRTSIALFVLGPIDGKVEAPPQLMDSDHPRRYVPLDFEEYRKLRTSTKSPTGEALELFLA